VKIFFSYAIPVCLTLLMITLPTSMLIYTILCMMLIMIIYPSSILSRNMNTDYRILTLQVIYFFSVYFIANRFSIRIKTPTILHQQKTYFLLIISVVLITPFVIIFSPHLTLSNLLLSNIYESRSVETQLSNPYTSYIYAPLSNVILPLLLLYGLLNREYPKALMALAMLLFMFLVGGHKSVFFGILFLLMFSFGSYYKKLKYFLSGLIVFFVISLISYLTTKNLFLTSLINRRIFFLPAILDVGYFDFFDENPLFWSDSIFRHFIEYPLNLPAKNLVAEHVINDVKTNANNGIISDGFMNLGVAGALMNIIMVSVVFGILNSLKINHRFFGMIFLLFFTFYSSYFFTSMITQGGLLLLIISYFFLKDTEYSLDSK
jgi:hypothetical protein